MTELPISMFEILTKLTGDLRMLKLPDIIANFIYQFQNIDEFGDII